MKRNLWLAVLAIWLGGCSFLAPWNQKLTVHAEPDDARIYLNGDLAGQGHVTRKVRRNKQVSVLVSHPDYRDQSTEVKTTLSTIGTVDLVGGALILLPAVGLLSPGAWDLQQGSVVVILEK